MKKAIKTVISLCIISFLFVGCKKDEPSKWNELMGTRWEATISQGTLRLTFIDHVNAVYSERFTGQNPKVYSTTYIYAAPNIRVNVNDHNEEFEFNGEVSSTSLKLTLGYHGHIYDFRKIN